MIKLGRKNRPAAVKDEDFDRVARGILRRSAAAGKLRPCPDQYVGLINSFVPGSDFPERSKPSRRRSGKCILMVLESPHRSEFGRKRHGVWIAHDPGPAYGATGKAITRHISKVIDPGTYRNFGLVLINAVQYQCSRGKSPLDEKVRDQNFVQIWNRGGRDAFEQRLSNICRPRDVIINACTKGKSGKLGELRGLVQEAIDSKKLLSRSHTLRSTHPASWRDAERIKRAC